MKQCPQCNRTYADETLSFCIADGALLSASNNLDLQLPSLPRPINYPPTEVLRSQSSPLQIERQSSTPRLLYAAILAISIFATGIGVAFFYERSKDKVTPDSPKPSATQASVSNTANTPSSTPDTSALQASPRQNNQAMSKPSPTVTLFRVVGVADDDYLAVRSAPGKDNAEVWKLAPGETGIQITGAGVKVGKSIWVPIKYGYIEGWVNSKFLTEQ